MLNPYAQIQEAIFNRRNVFLTGSAGTGKTFLLNQLREEYNIAVTASTGIAAVNIGGMTIHAFAGLGIGDRGPRTIVNMMKEETFDRIRYCKILAIDEISMLNARMLDLLNAVFKRVRGNDLPFGGVILITIGDFLQLPPVNKNNEEKFAFESDAWQEANFVNVILKKVWRQSDEKFLSILAKMRFGHMDGDDHQHIVQSETDDRDILRLFALNKAADEFNAMRLNELKTKEFYYRGEDTGDISHRELLDKNCITPKDLYLKNGARVMLLKNIDTENGLVNGSTGFVKRCFNHGVDVDFDNGMSVFLDKVVVCEMKINNFVLAKREQIPLRLAWAISIHKSQGMTLDRVKIDMNGIFEYGQAYVALSRARSIEGLYVNNFSRKVVKAHPKALEFMSQLESSQ